MVKIKISLLLCNSLLIIRPPHHPALISMSTVLYYLTLIHSPTSVVGLVSVTGRRITELCLESSQCRSPGVT